LPKLKVLKMIDCEIKDKLLNSGFVLLIMQFPEKTLYFGYQPLKRHKFIKVESDTRVPKSLFLNKKNPIFLHIDYKGYF
jgi:hypothetical protein